MCGRRTAWREWDSSVKPGMGEEGGAERGWVVCFITSVKNLTQTNNWLLGWASWVGLRVMWATNEVAGVGKCWSVRVCGTLWVCEGLGSWRNRVVHRVRCVRVCGKGSGGGSVGSQRFRQVELLCMGMESKSVGWDGVGVGVGLLHCVCCVHLFVFIILLVI